MTQQEPILLLVHPTQPIVMLGTSLISSQDFEMSATKTTTGGLSYKPYKMVVTVKSLHNFSNSNPNDPHAFKEELKIKFGAVSAITKSFLSRTGILEHLLQAETPSLDWDNYCGLGAPAQLIYMYLKLTSLMLGRHNLFKKY